MGMHSYYTVFSDDPGRVERAPRRGFVAGMYDVCTGNRVEL